MIMLLNAESVFTETLVGLRQVVAKFLVIPEEWVAVQLRRTENSFVPEIAINTPPQGQMLLESFGSPLATVSEAEIKLGLEKLIGEAMQHIKSGLAGLGT